MGSVTVLPWQRLPEWQMVVKDHVISQKYQIAVAALTAQPST
jgi:hypothetical protein